MRGGDRGRAAVEARGVMLDTHDLPPYPFTDRAGRLLVALYVGSLILLWVLP